MTVQQRYEWCIGIEKKDILRKDIFKKKDILRKDIFKKKDILRKDIFKKKDILRKDIFKKKDIFRKDIFKKRDILRKDIFKKKDILRKDIFKKKDIFRKDIFKKKDILRKDISRSLFVFVGCLTSQQQTSVSQGRVCSDNFTCCHTEIEVADQTFYLTQSQYTNTEPTSPSTDPITPGAWQGSHWSANF